MPRTHPIPSVDGVLTSEQVAETAASIVSMQEPDGAVPWTVGEHVDVWNHVEAAMALHVAGEQDAAAAAYEWCLRHQRHDGSWAMKTVAGEVQDASGETNMSAYLAVGVWHHWMLRRDLGGAQDPGDGRDTGEMGHRIGTSLSRRHRGLRK